ncbi:transposase [Nitrospinota bacterium]
MAWRGLTDRQWKHIQPHFPPRKVNPKGGRPWADDRKCFEGILWILWTGAPWSELPRRYGSPTTCWQRLKQWEEDGTLLALWRAFLADLNDRRKIRWDECFADGSFALAKKGATKSGKPRGARERSGWFWSMARVLRWEHTWTRRRRRRSPSSKRPSPRSR